MKRKLKTPITQSYIDWLGPVAKCKIDAAELENRREELTLLIELLHDKISWDEVMNTKHGYRLKFEIEKYKQPNFTFKDQVRMVLVKRTFGMVVCLTRTIWDGDTWGAMNRSFALEFVGQRGKKMNWKDLRVVMTAVRKHLQEAGYDRDTFQIELHHVLVDVLNDKKTAENYKIHALFRKRAFDWCGQAIDTSRDMAANGIKVFSEESVREHLIKTYEKFMNQTPQREEIRSMNNTFYSVAPKMDFHLFFVVLEDTLRKSGHTAQDYEQVCDWIADGGVANPDNEIELPTDLILIAREVLSDFVGSVGFDIY